MRVDRYKNNEFKLVSDKGQLRTGQPVLLRFREGEQGVPSEDSVYYNWDGVKNGRLTFELATEKKNKYPQYIELSLPDFADRWTGETAPYSNSVADLQQDALLDEGFITL